MNEKYNRRKTQGNAEHSNAEPSSNSNAINYEIHNLTKRLAKSLNYSFQAAKKRNEENPVDEMQRRVLKRLRPMYSTDRFLELMRHLHTLSTFERMELLRDIETNLPKRGR